MHFDVQTVSTHSLAIALALTMAPTSATAAERELDFRDLRAIDSGHHSYYELRMDDRGTYLHAEFRPGDDGSFLLRQEPS